MSNDVEVQILEELKGINTRLDGIDKRLDGHDKKFDKIDKKLEEHDKKFDKIDKRFDDVNDTFMEQNKKFSIVDKKLGKMYDTLQDIKKSTLLMEYDHSEKIRILLDSHLANHEDHVLFELKFNNKIKHLENAIYVNSSEIDKLKRKIS